MLIDGLGFIAAAVVFLTFCMQTMLTLRLAAIVSNLAFIGYALAAGLAPILVLHGALLPLILWRLVQMRRQTCTTLPARLASTGLESFEWLIPLGWRREVAAGATLFAKGDPAESLFVVVEGGMQVP